MEGISFPELSPREQAEAVRENEKSYQDAEGKDGDKVYLVSNRWFSAWCQYTGFSYDPARKRTTIAKLAQPGPRPGPIDCSDLVDDRQEAGGREPDLNERERAEIVRLKERLPPYFLARESTFKLLKEWYGVSGPEVWVELMAVGPGSGRVEFDPHPWHLKAVLEASEAAQHYKSVVVAASKQCTVMNLKRRCCQALGVNEADYEIMDFYGMEKAEKLDTKLFKTLTGASLLPQQAVLLRHKDRAKEVEEEEKEAALSSPRPSLQMSSSPAFLSSSPLGVPSSPLSRSMSKAPAWAEDAIQTSASRRRGLAGLGNLGNTCFMNSSVQCLAHTVPVMETFLTERYKSDINTDNPLGQGGKLASCFGALMEKLWQGGVSSVSPKRFKWQLARFAPQFQGYAQQDSQELLAFLLDGLHEDLNRIKVKPYIEEKDDDGRPDAELAGEAWTNYRARNDSIIVDNFQGLYKSTLVCPRCGHKSRKFDPFMYLSLPLPTAKTRTFSIVVVSVDGCEPPTQYSVEVPKNATIRQLCAALGKVCGVPAGTPAEEVLLLAQFSPSSYVPNKTELFNDPEVRVSAIKEPSKSFFSSSSKTVLLAYRYPDPSVGPRAQGRKQAVVVHKLKGQVSVPATPLYPTPQELSSLRLELAKPISGYGSTPEWDVALGEGNVLETATRRLLRPFRWPQHQQQQDEEAGGAVVGPAGVSAPIPGPEAEGSGEAGPAAVGGGEDGEAMDLEQPPTPNAESIADVSPCSSSGGGGGGSGSGGGLEGLADAVADADAAMALDPDENVPPPVEGGGGFIGPQLPPSSWDSAGALPAADEQAPFDMWAAQKAAAEPTAGAMHDEQQQQQPQQPPRAPYYFRLANPDGRTIQAYGAEPQPPNLAEEEGPVFFTAEWSKEGSEVYNPGVLDRPAKHQSVLDAEAAAVERGGKRVTLADCMESFLQPEQLDAEDSWYCSKCKEHVQADKKLDLWSLPEVLVVHLKRFSYSRYSRDKLDTVVEFPLEGADLSGYLLQGGQCGSCMYDLFAVSNHYGGLGGGHYTAYCKMPDDGKWYLFDDSSVRDATEREVVSSAAYVLFYRRAGSKVDLPSLFAAQQQQHAERGETQASEAISIEASGGTDSLQFPMQIGSP